MKHTFRFVFLYSLLPLVIYISVANCSSESESTKNDDKETTENSETNQSNEQNNESLTADISLPDTETIIRKLSSDEFRGRYPGDRGFELAADYIVDLFKEYEIEPYFGSGYLDTVVVGGRTSYNVVGFLGKKEDGRENILIGAHLDHLQARSGSGGDIIFNGANDNAAGVTAVMQIAKHLSGKAFDKNVIFALFTEEENGILGSRHLANRLKNEGVSLDYMINYEMIGTVYKSENKVYLTGFDRSDFAQKANALLGSSFIERLDTEAQFGLFSRSDNAPFFEIYNIPAHTISTYDFTNFDHYHRLGDEYEELNTTNMNKIINTSAVLVEKILEQNTVFSLK